MKKYFLLVAILILITNLFAQTYEWGPWVQNSCFKGLASRCKVRDYNDAAKQYTWDLEIKNNYGSKVSFNFDIQNSSIDGRTSINPGGTDKGWTLNPSNSGLTIEFSKVCFDLNDNCSINSNGTQNKGYKCYAECDNGVPSVPKLCSNTNSQTNNSNQQTTQPNNLSEYNRNKAELERQMQEENNRRQQQANQQANQKQQFINVYNEGVRLGNTGRYSEAASKYQQALGLATNQADRQTAQNAYNKISKASTHQQSLNQLSSSLMDLAKVIDAAKEEKRQKREQERLEYERQKKERKQQAALAAEEIASQLKIANGFTDLESVEGYEKAIQIMLPYATDNRLNGMALNQIGYWYWKLHDYESAMKWYFEAEQMGDNNAIRNIGVLYYKGMGVPQNTWLALKCFQEACLGGLQDGCRDFKTVKEEFQQKVAGSNNIDDYDVRLAAELYFEDKDYSQAAKYYKQAYKFDTTENWVAVLKLADMYFEKHQLNDKDSSAKWYAIGIKLFESDSGSWNNSEPAVKKQFSDTYLKLLLNYAMSLKQTDGQSAINAFLKATKSGYINSPIQVREIYEEVAAIYESGEGGVEKDWDKSRMYYEKAAENNSAKAMYYLGKLYANGGPNLDENQKESKKWFKAACKANKNYCK